MTFNGDIKNSVEALRRELRKLKCSKEVDFHSLVTGTHWGFVNLYRFLFCDYSVPLASSFIEHGFELTGTTDFKFMETVYKILRDLFNYKPPLTVSQFFSAGFPERKLAMAATICAKLGHQSNSITRPSVQKAVLSQAILGTNHRKKKTTQDDGIEIVDYTQVAREKQDGRPPTKTSSKKSHSANSSHRGNRKPKSSPVVRKHPSPGGGAPKPLGRSWEEPVVRSAPHTVAPVRGYSSGDEGSSRPQDSPGSQMSLLTELLHGGRRVVDVPGVGAPFAGQNKAGDERAASSRGMSLQTVDTSNPPRHNNTNNYEREAEWAVDSTLATAVHKITRELENVTARLTLVETRMQHVECQLDSRTSQPISPSRSSANPAGLGGGSLSSSPYKPAPGSRGLAQGMPSDLSRQPVSSLGSYRSVIQPTQEPTPLSQARQLFRDTEKPRTTSIEDYESVRVDGNTSGGSSKKFGANGMQKYDLVVTDKYSDKCRSSSAEPYRSSRTDTYDNQKPTGSGDKYLSAGSNRSELFGTRDINAQDNDSGFDRPYRGDSRERYNSRESEGYSGSKKTKFDTHSIESEGNERPNSKVVHLASDPNRQRRWSGDEQSSFTKKHSIETSDKFERGGGPERKSYSWLRPLDASDEPGPPGNESERTASEDLTLREEVSMAPTSDPNKENHNGGISYRSQADRIASMLADTQTMLTTNN